MQTLVVLPYSQKGAQGEEIRIALKGWQKFCQFDYHFAVIGDFDESLQTEFSWVEFISVERISKRAGQYTPLLDVQNKMEVAYNKFSGEYDGFIRMMDDFYAIKPFELSDITKTYYHSLTFTGNKNAPVNFWSNSKWKTRQLLDREKLPHVNYTAHLPCYIEFDKVKELWDRFNMREESLVLDDLYYNYFSHDKAILDSKFRLGVWNKDIFRKDFKKAVANPNIKFVCNSVEGWCKELENELKKIVW